MTSTGIRVPADIAELLTRHDQDFVEAAYLLTLGRPVDPSGLDFYLKRLRNGGSRHRIVAELALSDEAKFRRAQTKGLQEHLRAYRKSNHYLRRLVQLWIGDDDFAENERIRRNRKLRYASAAAHVPSRDQPSVHCAIEVDSAETIEIFKKLKRAVKG